MLNSDKDPIQTSPLPVPCLCQMNWLTLRKMQVSKLSNHLEKRRSSSSAGTYEAELLKKYLQTQLQLADRIRRTETQLKNARRELQELREKLKQIDRRAIATEESTAWAHDWLKWLNGDM